MAKSNKTKLELSFVDIVMGATADVIKAAYDARIQIDALLQQRQEAYAQICELEEQVEDLLGEDALFEFPAPPLPVAGHNGTASTSTRRGGSSRSNRTTAASRGRLGNNPGSTTSASSSPATADPVTPPANADDPTTTAAMPAAAATDGSETLADQA